MNALTPRQRQVLLAASHGLSNQGIMDVLGISERSVESAFECIYRKMGIADDPEWSPRVRAVVVWLHAA